LRAIVGLQRPSAHSVTFGLDRRDLGILFQDAALLPWRTALDNVALGLRIRGKPRPPVRDEAEAWLGKLGLAGFGQRFPRALSGGQRNRVALV
jgi:NitT/TauT family transport system ATP-binding protein